MLQSCIKDHNFPGPEGPDGPLLDLDIDWNGLAKKVVSEGLGELPEAGKFLSNLLDIVWPSSGDSPWDQVKAQVGALIDSKIATEAYDRMASVLKGDRAIIDDYNRAVKNNTNVYTSWSNVFYQLEHDKEQFKEEGQELVLLPLFAQFVNLHLGLLRDGILYGKTWGMSQTEWQSYVDLTHDRVTEFTDWVNNWYDKGRSPRANKNVDMWKVEPFRSTNEFDRTMTMLVLDYKDTWLYYDYTRYPNGAKNPDGTPMRLFIREIYSDPHGNILGVGNNPVMPLILPSPATELPTLLTVWSGDRIDAVQVAGYPANGGPGFASETPRMGDKNGGTAHTFNLSPFNPITQVNINTYHSPSNGDEMATDTLEFIFNDGTGTGRMGKTTGDSKLFSIGYAGYALSSIYVQGTSYWDPGKSINCIVFGFVPWPFHN
ncbi:insecticidal delta-endotoxin Cry8Ea1 family protein [Larkinella harenae]